MHPHRGPRILSVWSKDGLINHLMLGQGAEVSMLHAGKTNSARDAQRGPQAQAFSADNPEE